MTDALEVTTSDIGELEGTAETAVQIGNNYCLGGVLSDTAEAVSGASGELAQIRQEWSRLLSERSRGVYGTTSANMIKNGKDLRDSMYQGDLVDAQYKRGLVDSSGDLTKQGQLQYAKLKDQVSNNILRGSGTPEQEIARKQMTEWIMKEWQSNMKRFENMNNSLMKAVTNPEYGFGAGGSSEQLEELLSSKGGWYGFHRNGPSEEFFQLAKSGKEKAWKALSVTEIGKVSHLMGEIQNLGERFHNMLMREMNAPTDLLNRQRVVYRVGEKISKEDWSFEFNERIGALKYDPITDTYEVAKSLSQIMRTTTVEGDASLPMLGKAFSEELGSTFKLKGPNAEFWKPGGQWDVGVPGGMSKITTQTDIDFANEVEAKMKSVAANIDKYQSDLAKLRTWPRFSKAWNFLGKGARGIIGFGKGVASWTWAGIKRTGDFMAYLMKDANPLTVLSNLIKTVGIGIGCWYLYSHVFNPMINGICRMLSGCNVSRSGTSEADYAGGAPSMSVVPYQCMDPMLKNWEYETLCAAPEDSEWWKRGWGMNPSGAPECPPSNPVGLTPSQDSYCLLTPSTTPSVWPLVAANRFPPSKIGCNLFGAEQGAPSLPPSTMAMGKGGYSFQPFTCNFADLVAKSMVEAGEDVGKGLSFLEWIEEHAPLIGGAIVLMFVMFLATDLFNR